MLADQVYSNADDYGDHDHCDYSVEAVPPVVVLVILFEKHTSDQLGNKPEQYSGTEENVAVPIGERHSAECGGEVCSENSEKDVRREQVAKHVVHHKKENEQKEQPKADARSVLRRLDEALHHYEERVTRAEHDGVDREDRYDVEREGDKGPCGSRLILVADEVFDEVDDDIHAEIRHEVEECEENMRERGIEERVDYPLALARGKAVGDAVEVTRGEDRREHLGQRRSEDDADDDSDHGERALNDEVRLHAVIVERNETVDSFHVPADEAGNVASKVENDAENDEVEEINEEIDDRLNVDKQ